MFQRTCLGTFSLLLLCAPITPSQEPKNVQEALALIAKIDGKVKFDAQRKVVIEIDV